MTDKKDDTISRQAAIDALEKNRFPGAPYIDSGIQIALREIKALKSAQPECSERLTNKDFETIRIHLTTYKRKLCSKQRWKEAEEYQRIIDRFMAFASAQLEQRWIPISERLPETDDEVLITVLDMEEDYAEVYKGF